MDGDDRMDRQKTLAQRLGLKGMGCCGTSWGVRPSNVDVEDHSDDDELGPPLVQPQSEVVGLDRVPRIDDTDPDCNGGGQVVSGMNLADALAAERGVNGDDDDDSPTGTENEEETPFKMSLMRLLEETDDGDGEGNNEPRSTGSYTPCCVCMSKMKASAFIPCGHTFCRVCSRELWLNRGSCPLCNRQIIQILDIY